MLSWDKLVKSAGGREYLYIIVDDCTRTVYTKPLWLKSEAIEVFKMFKAAAENESGMKIQEVMTDNAYCLIPPCIPCG